MIRCLVVVVCLLTLGGCARKVVVDPSQVAGLNDPNWRILHEPAGQARAQR